LSSWTETQQGTGELHREDTPRPVVPPPTHGRRQRVRHDQGQGEGRQRAIPQPQGQLRRPHGRSTSRPGSTEGVRRLYAEDAQLAWFSGRAGTHGSVKMIHSLVVCILSMNRDIFI